MKKILCVFLACIMLFGTLTAGTVSAAEDSYDHLPQIFVAGLGSRPVYYKDDPEKTSLFYPVETDRLIANVSNIDDYLLEALLKRDYRLIYNLVYSFLWDSFGIIRMNPDGLTYSEELTMDPVKLSYKGDGYYEFNYDSRLGPVDIARQLNDYVAMVQEHSGSQRFELVGSSMGTAAVMAYLEMYPESRQYVDSVLLCVPSVEGVDFISELFTGNFDVNADNLHSFINLLAANEDLDLFLAVLEKSGVLDLFVERALEPFMREALLNALMDILRDIFATLPAAWSVVQPPEFYDALETMFGENYADPDHEYAVLIDKVIYYQENVMKKARELMTDWTAEGLKMNVVCKYGRPVVPLSKDGNVMSDGLVELEKSSFGATVARFGEALPADYIQAEYPGYAFISPDSAVDASTCALPFNTWFIKGLEHGTKNDDYYELLDAVVYEDLDIFSSPEYPQFMEVSAEDDDRLIPMAEAERQRETGLITDVVRLVLRILSVVAEQIKKLTGQTL